MKLDRKRLLGWARDAALLVAVLVGVHFWVTRNVARGPAPQVEGLQALRGQPVLVHFWATWCPVCRQEEGTIAALAKDRPVITIATQSGSSAEISAYLAKRGVQLPFVPDPESKLAALYGVNSFPTSFVIDRDGKIRFVEVGYTTSLGLRLRLWLAGVI